MVDQFGHTISVIEYIASNRYRRHIAGGILLSFAVLFGSLALTVMTVKSEEDQYED